MLGLITQENNEFIKFFKLVQDEAKTLNKVFFLDFGQSDDIPFSAMEVDSLFGWLTPNEKVEEFNSKFMKGTNLSKWDEYCFWAIADIRDDKLNLVFE